MAKMTKKQANDLGKKLGISGAHKMPDGSIHPGKTHKAFQDARKKRK